MNNLELRKANIWNHRLSELMAKGKYSQARLADEMNKRYVYERKKSFTQKGVGRWTKVGFSIDFGKEIGFPEYSTMLYIADFFGVDVGYLTGETDSEKFDIEKTSQFLGLNDDAIKQLMRLTHADDGGLPSPFVQSIREAVIHLFSSDDFFYLISRMKEMYSFSPVSGVPEYNKQDHFEGAMGYAQDVNESLSMARFQTYETFFRLLDNLYPYATTEDFLISEEF